MSVMTAFLYNQEHFLCTVYRYCFLFGLCNDDYEYSFWRGREGVGKSEQNVDTWFTVSYWHSFRSND